MPYQAWFDVGVPLFVSHRRLRRAKRLPQARAPWALDSGGFSEIAEHGRWVTSQDEYVDAARRYAEIGWMDWAAPQDWMCEPAMVRATGLTVEEHQERTIESVLSLRQSAPEVPWIPVLQGWELGDYEACVGRYARAGLDLTTEPVVGVGSVCRRQHTGEIAEILHELAGAGLRLHGFGVKGGVTAYRDSLVSADSMAWSYNARRNPPLEGCSHRSCSNCLRWALRWRERLLTRTAEPYQMMLR